MQSINHVTAGVDWTIAKTTQLLQTTNMIIMNMSDEQSIKMGVTSAQNLLAEVGTTVYHYALATPFQQGRLPQALVARVA